MHYFLCKTVLVFICLWSVSNVFTQGNSKELQYKKDSLYRIIFDNKSEFSAQTAAINAINTFRIPMEDTVYNHIKKLLTDANCTPKDKVNLHHYYGLGYYRKGGLSEAENQLEQAYRIFKTNHQLDIDPYFLVNYGLIKNNLGKNDEAIAIYLEGIQINEKTKHHKNLGNLYIKLGDVYVNMQKYDDANKYYYQAVASGKRANNKNVVAYALRGLGTSALDAENFAEAETMFKDALVLFDSLQHQFMIHDIKCYLAATYDEMGRFDEAELLYDEAHEYFKNSGYDADMYYISVDKGKHYIKKGDYKKAILNCTYAKDNFLKIGDIAWAAKAWMCMYDAAKLSGNHKAALAYYEGYVKYSDSLVNEKNIQKITELRKDYEFNQEREKIALENLQKIEREKMFQKFMGFGLLLLGGLLFFAYRAYLIKTRANKTINDQKDQLELYNKANENLIYSLSHDIKEPMLGVQLLLQKIKSEDPVLQKANQSIGDQVSSINSIVNNLLQLKKSYTAHQSDISDHDTIIKTIQTITDQLQYKLNDKNILIINTVSATPGLSLPISAQKLYFILLNLLTNAIKFSPDNQNIEIYAKSNGIYVRDHGKGIDPETMNNLGKKDIDKNETDGGSGMGIMLVSNLLAGSKVKLRFENAKGGGTVAGVVLV